MKTLGVSSILRSTSCMRRMNFSFSTRVEAWKNFTSAPAEKNRGTVLVSTTAWIPSSARTASTASSSSWANWRLYAFAGGRCSEICPTAPARSRLIISPTHATPILGRARSDTPGGPGRAAHPPGTQRRLPPSGHRSRTRGGLTARAGQPLAKAEPLDLPRRRLGQLRDELDPTRILVCRDLVADEPLQLHRQCLARGLPRL